MKLSLLPAGKGDCLLVTGADGRCLLVDGGTRESFRDYVAAPLARLSKIDAVCVSHIDDDHIAGILQLMDDAVAWRVHDYQQRSVNPGHRRPECSRPPGIGRIWHNAFHEQIGKNVGSIQSMLAATASVLAGADRSSVRALAQAQGELATSVGQGLRLSRRVGSGQLKIPLNPEFKGKLMLVGEGPVRIRLERMRVVVIGPFEEDLRKLRAEWNQWLRENRRALEQIRRQSREDERDLAAGEADRVLQPLLAQAERLGDRSRVTTPNLASLMLLVEEGDTRILLTGDGHARDILRGLERAGRLNARSGIHVEVLKVQHHGSEHNIDEAFCRSVTADHYVFSANGAHNNPDLRALEAILESRLGTPKQRSANPEAGNPFIVWLNSSSSVTEERKDKEHMREVERLMERRASARFKVRFRGRPSGALRVL